jgi:hypothetical protein
MCQKFQVKESGSESQNFIGRIKKNCSVGQDWEKLDASIRHVAAVAHLRVQRAL